MPRHLLQPSMRFSARLIDGNAVHACRADTSCQLHCCPAEPSGDTAPPTRQSIFSKQQLAAVAASISRLPRQSVTALPPLHEHNHQRASRERQRRREEAEARDQQRLQEELQMQMQMQQMQEEDEQARRYRASLEQARLAALQQQQQAEEEAAEAERRVRQQRRGSRPASLRSSREPGSREPAQDGQVERAGRASPDADQLSGFTVYTNELEAADARAVDEGEVAQPEPPAERRLRDSHGSGVEWRSISSAALSSRSARSEKAEEAAAAGAGQAFSREQQAARRSHNSLRGSCGSLQQRRVHEQAAAAARAGEQPEPQQQGAKIRQHARQLSRLVLPDLDASQASQQGRVQLSRHACWTYANLLAMLYLLCNDPHFPESTLA